ncbi:MAG: hypothetical protein ABI643_04210 [Candidatus Doudnabacteria bacterium]
MTDYKIYLGYAAIAIGFIGYVPYIRDIFKNETKPHFFSWFLWGLIESIILAIQINQKAGAGAWVTGFTALACFIVAGLSVKKGVKEFHRIDWLLFAAALVSLVLWRLTKNPLSSTILLIITDAAAFSITFRKTFHHPFSETLIEYFFSALKSLVGIFALQTYNLNTWLFFAYLVFANSAFVVMALIRRKQLKQN